MDSKLDILAHRVRENGEFTRRDEKEMNEIDEALTAILLGAERCLRPPPRVNRMSHFQWN